MRAPSDPLFTITLDEVMQDLEAGHGRPLSPTTSEIRPLRRPVVGGPRFRALWLAATALGRIHPRLARGALSRLWFTPWVHSALRAVSLPGCFVPWALPTDAGDLRGFVGGHGPTVVLVHGWSGRSLDWRHLAQDLVEAGYRVVAPDLPAHGQTAGRRTDLYVLGVAMAGVLAHERPAAVVAHSMGFPATLLAVERGEREPERIVALAPGRKVERVVSGFARMMGLSAGLTDQLGRDLEARFGAEVWDELDVDRVVHDLGAAGLVIHDVDDDEVPVADGRAIAAAWPGATFASTAGLGHRRILRDAAVRSRILAAIASPGRHGTTRTELEAVTLTA